MLVAMIGLFALFSGSKQELIPQQAMSLVSTPSALVQNNLNKI